MPAQLDELDVVEAGEFAQFNSFFRVGVANDTNAVRRCSNCLQIFQAGVKNVELLEVWQQREKSMQKSRIHRNDSSLLDVWIWGNSFDDLVDVLKRSAGDGEFNAQHLWHRHDDL